MGCPDSLVGAVRQGTASEEDKRSKINLKRAFALFN